MAKRDIMSYDPLDRIFNIRDDFDSMLKDFFTGFAGREKGRRVYPLMDVKEDNDKFTLNLEIPGMKKEDIKLTMRKDELIIEGEKKEENKKEGESFLRMERSYGKFRRALKFETEIDYSKTKAVFEDGILRITLPKSEKEKPKEVEIKIK